MSLRFPRLRQHTSRLLLAAGIAAAFSTSHEALAVDGTWTNLSGGTWSTVGNWNASTIADGVGATANISTLNIVTGNRTITIDGAVASRTLGTLTIGDNNTTDRRSYIIAASGGGTLTFDNGGSNAVITQIANSNGDTISAPVILNSSLNITNNSTTSGSFTFTISGGITAGTAGVKTININGAAASGVTLSGIIGDGAGSIAINKASTTNTLTLSGANTFTGGVTLAAGTLSINNASAIGTGALTITGGTLASSGITLSTNNAQSWNGNFTFGGGNSLNLGTGAVAMNANRTITIGSSSDTLTVGGVISGAGFSLNTANSTSVVTGILALNGANTYDGGTNINGGVVRFGSGAAIPGTGLINVQTNGALSVSGAHTSLAGWLGNAALSTASTGALSLAGASSADNFDPGTAGFNTLGLGSNVGNTATYTGTYTPSASGYFIGGGGGTINFTNVGAFTGASNVTVGNGGGGTVIISEENAGYTGNVTIANGTLQLGAGGTVGSLGSPASIVNNGSLVLNRSDNQSLGLAISGTGSLTKLTTNTLTLTAANTYTGATTISAGTLKLGINDALPVGTALTLGSTGAAANLDLDTFNQTIGSLTVLTSFTLASGLAPTNPSVVTIASGKQLTVTGNMTIGRVATDVNNKVVFTGGGTLALTGTSSTLAVGLETSTTANITPVSFSTLDLTGLGSFTTNITNFDAVFAQEAGADVLLSNTNNEIKATTMRIGHSDGNNAGAASTLTLGTGTNVLNVDSIQLGISKGAGTIEFASQTPGSPGTVTIANKAGSGAANIIIASTEGTGTAANLVGNLDLRGHTANVTAGSIQIGKRSDSSSGNATGTLSFDAGTFTATSIDLGNRSSTGANPGSIATGTLNIGGGDFTVGTLNMANKSNTSTGSAVGTVNVSGGTLTVNTLFRLGIQASGGTSTGDLNITGGAVTANVAITDGGGAATTTLTLNGGTLNMTGKAIGSAGNPIDVLNFQSGTLNNVLSINGTGGLDKTTTGTLTLTGTNTYTGPTTVSAGMLVVNGSTTSNTSVVALATLAGSGTINGNVTSDGIVAPGNSIGTLTVVGDATFNAGSTYTAELGAANSSDLLNLTSVASNLSLSSLTDTLNLQSTLDPGTFTIIDYNGSRAGGIFDLVSFNNVAQGAPTVTLGAVNPTGFTGTGDLYNYGSFSVFYNDTATSVQVGITAIPEPSTFVLGGLALLGFAGVGLRRRRAARPQA